MPTSKEELRQELRHYLMKVAWTPVDGPADANRFKVYEDTIMQLIRAREREYGMFLLEHLESYDDGSGIWFRDDDGDAMPIEDVIDTLKGV